MGYDIHITRRNYYSENGSEIPLSEWLDVVARDAELTLEWNDDEWAEVVWTSAGEEMALLNYFDGRIFKKLPRNEGEGATPIINKMVRIAELLSAKLLGDDDERYFGDGRIVETEEYD